MQRSVVRVISGHCLLISALFHLMLLSGMTIIWISAPPLTKSPGMYVPAYTYQEPRRQTIPTTNQAVSQPKETPKEAPKQDEGEAIRIPNATNKQSVNEVQVKRDSKKTEAIHLVGDKKIVPQPLIKLLGKALTAHLLYPKIASDFKVKGTAYVGFSIHPDGEVTDVAIVQSSQAGILDEQAVSAVRAISPVKGAGEFVDKKRYLVVGIIFN